MGAKLVRWGLVDEDTPPAFRTALTRPVIFAASPSAQSAFDIEHSRRWEVIIRPRLVWSATGTVESPDSVAGLWGLVREAVRDCGANGTAPA